MRVDVAVRKLSGILPLFLRQKELSRSLAGAHRAILRSFVERGRPLSMKEVGSLVPDGDGRAALAALARGALVVLDDGGESIEGAYPMTTAKTPHCLDVEGHKFHAMCALDALGVSPMFDVKTVIESRCHITGERIRLEQLNQEILEASPSGRINVGIRWHSGDGTAAHNL